MSTETEHLIGKEVFVYGLGYIVWDRENADAAQELLDEIERIAPTRIDLATQRSEER